MKPIIEPVESVHADEERQFPDIPLFVSSNSSHGSESLAGNHLVASSGTDGGSVGSSKQHSVTNQRTRSQLVTPPESREQDGRPPLPQHLKHQPREDTLKPLALNRDQSAGTAISALTESTPECSPSRPTRSVDHCRKISWDTGVLDTAIRLQESTSPSDEFFSVADLHATSPLEAEAETSILKAIEEQDEQEPSSMRRTIFPEVSEHVAESIRMMKSDGSSASNGRRESGVRGHRRNKTGMTASRRGTTLEATLLDLTVAIREMNEESEDLEAIPEEGSHSPNDPSLIDNANILFRRKAITRQKSARYLGQSQTFGGIESGSDIDLEMGESEDFPDGGEGNDDEKPRRGRGRMNRLGKAVEKDWTLFSDFIRPRRSSIMLQFKAILFAFIFPAMVVAVILFYAADNPDLGSHGASISWLVLFLVRHSILYTLANLTQLLLIDFLTLNMRCTVRVMGAFPSLCLVQSRGFPFIISCWGLYGFLMLCGNNRFARHWMFYQDVFLLLSEANPAGTITDSGMNYAILTCALVFGIVVTVKRVFLGLYFGKRIYAHFGDAVAKVVHKVLLVGEVASLAADLDHGFALESIQMRAAVLAFNTESVEYKCAQGDEDVSSAGVSSGLTSSPRPDGLRRDRYTGSITQSQRNEIMGLLESWEEPETEKKARIDDVPISAILQFRQTLVLTANEFPFSMKFGLADTREHCIESSQKVYKRLLLRQPPGDSVLDFDTIALLATTDDGGIDSDKMKDFIHIFRPQRDGTLTMVDFVKSVDKVYKNLRLLSASISNAAQIDAAAERIFNCVFYVICTIVIVSILGFDPMALFLSISSIIVAFAFMIANASSRWFEGMLFVLIRRPYSIGDRIHVSPVDQDTSPNGSSTWYVEHVDLFTTTVRFATTNEVATVSNGSLSNTRVINAARSPKMLVYVYMKFGVDVPYQKVKLFRKTVEEFVKQRPRDWLSMCGFRATRVEQELGYIEYVMVLQHRERWQNVVAMLNAKAEFSSFALEVAKKLEMPYRAPSLPVDLNMMGSRDAAMSRVKEEVNADTNLESMMKSISDHSAPDMSDVAALFAAASVG